MNKVDCSKAVIYLEEKSRMCHKSCKDCILGEYKNGTGWDCESFEIMFPERAVEKIQAWSDSHERYTYFDVLKERLEKTGLPSINAMAEIIKKKASTTMIFGKLCPDWDEVCMWGDLKDEKTED